ncbi:glutathione S-transferase family protein [Halotalea alkalilenta]|uniref:Glutathione S-transferase n=1 Tax=Halotalea alkalilenta TaxID=376489 RepID=A0A172YHX6_9GAMM|nr:glutathione S-transferase [Halotalea alkalilenta]ANF58793.1 glutathione S-transferase [Halotalea alkalilenta]
MLRIWGRANSSNVKKVLWCAEELGLRFERIDAGGAFGLVDGEEFRKMNPNGLVPCIEDDGFVLWESNAIIRYLLARHGDDSTLLPATLEGRASAERWMDWCSFSLSAPFAVLVKHLVRSPPERRDAQAVVPAAASFEASMRIADAELAQSAWFSGESFGIGDIPLGVLVYSWYALPGLERPSLPALEDWQRRLAERPAFLHWVAVPLS